MRSHAGAWKREKRENERYKVYKYLILLLYFRLYLWRQSGLRLPPAFQHPGYGGENNNESEATHDACNGGVRL